MLGVCEYFLYTVGMASFESNPNAAMPDEEKDISVLWTENMVKELREPTQRIMEKLSPALESGEIQLIVGDDASGRIPTAIFRKIFDLAYKERGFTTPETRFIAGSRELQGEEKQTKKEKIAEYLERVKKDVEKKFRQPLKNALIVTDIIHTGKSLDPLIEALNEMGVRITIVSIGIFSGQRKLGEKEDRWHAQVFCGGFGTPSVYGELSNAGVSKKTEDLFSKPIKGANGINDEKDEARVQKKINKSREISSIVAEEIYEKWKSFHSQKDKK
jgi:adenine/guanine phosphoribosyltransferase-like PRPP-binding protein